jgi:hypothetical protein
VQRVGHHHAIEVAQREVAREVGGLRLQLRGFALDGEARVGALELGERGAVLVDRVDGGAGGKQIGQRERERALARAEVGPDTYPTRRAHGLSRHGADAVPQ